MRMHLAVSLVAAAALAVPAGAGDRRLLALVAREVPRVDAAERAAAAADPEAVQVQYDVGRDLEEALRLASPVSTSCRMLLQAARSLARAEVLQAEGVDRLDPRITSRGRRQAAHARRQIGVGRAACRPRAAQSRQVQARQLDQPRSNEAFFGTIAGKAPAGTALAQVRLTGRAPTRVGVRRNRLRYRLGAPPGRYDIRVAYLDARGRILQRAVSRAVWLLPSTAARATGPKRPNKRLSRRLRKLAQSFPGHSAMWLHDLTRGTTAEWNADAQFPAASTVKLALLIAALDRFGPRPERSRVAYDLGTLAGWSSNLASNRLLDEVGGTAVAQDVLRRLGARSSTFTGDYRIGTRAGSADQPPRISSRVTTARDLGRILFQFHAAVLGQRQARTAARLSPHEARVGLALLLSSQPVADNVGLFQTALGRRVPLAQKNGWFSAVRHTAAVVYTADGPWIAVLLTYRPGITLREAVDLGRRLIRVLRTR